MNGLEFINFLKTLEETIKILNKKYNFISIGKSKIKYNTNSFNENDNTFLINLDNYIDSLNDIMDNEFHVHFSFQYLDDDGTIYLFPDFIEDEPTEIMDF